MVVRRLWELQRLGKLSEMAREREREIFISDWMLISIRNERLMIGCCFTSRE